MCKRANLRRWLGGGVLAIAMGVLGPPAWAQDENAMAEDEEELGEALSFSAGFDVASAYYFRGIPQEDRGIITQPWAEFGINLFSNEKDNAQLSSVDLTFGTWNSLHSTNGDDPWYESDFYASLSASVACLELSATYTYLYAPNLPVSPGIFAEEIGFGISLDDSKLWKDAQLDFGGLQPSASLVFEIDGGSDGAGEAGDAGIYFELGIEPGMEFATEDTNAIGDIGVSVPVTLGLSLADYYEVSTADDGDTFGFLDIAPSVTIPLDFVAKRYGSWTLGGSLHFLILGNSTRRIGGEEAFGVNTGGGDTFEIYTSWGLTVEM